MCHHAGFRWGGVAQKELTRGSGPRGGSREGRLSGLCGLCCVFSLSVSLLLLFPLSAVLLNCPYPDPLVSACFFPFSSAPRRGEGRLSGTFVAGRSQTITQCHKLSGLMLQNALRWKFNSSLPLCLEHCLVEGQYKSRCKIFLLEF